MPETTNEELPWFETILYGVLVIAGFLMSLGGGEMAYMLFTGGVIACLLIYAIAMTMKDTDFKWGYLILALCAIGMFINFFFMEWMSRNQVILQVVIFILTSVFYLVVLSKRKAVDQ